ncbi:STAS domain-containing protein [Blastococcus goldschmidtiae]|uniref:Anti-sigma factor antagonist n=1 Tax=Blastococcus goldschmidtiae TaxID=3075546 RepID=A0ABU2KD38_9ACTN|nr:STAS domain-containing protein [Blastococcus sp. DSM 46792]MDT0278083.1 STAS domain-containing protein [Blastococcus sp. DSM 46792]
MADSAAHGPGQDNETEPRVHAAVDGDVVSVTVEGELTEAARRPLVRILTEKLLSKQPLRRVELHLAGVPFTNSAGIAVLVQLQRMAAPRGVEVALVTPSTAVARPLQMTGLWHRFPIVDENGDEEPADHSTTGPDGTPREHA